MSGRVLIVDDHTANLKLTRLVLERAGFDVRTAENAPDARAVIAGFAPELILLDIQMPDVDGLTFARELRADPTTSGIVIVALTAHAMKGDDEKALAAGCDGYLAKPMDVQRLPGQVRAWLRQEKS